MPGDALTNVEQLRLEHMKVFRVRKLKFREMVPLLHALGLLECQNCKAGTPRKRVLASGDEVCATCENTISVFWKRNTDKLTDDFADLHHVRWEWQEGKLRLQQIAMEHYRQKVVTVTTRRETKAGEDGAPVTIEHVTTREEWRIYPELLRLYDDLGDALARINGMDTKHPPKPRPRPVTVHFHERDTDSNGDTPN